MSKEHLSTYLNDHLSGAVAALEILDHLIQEANDLSPFFTKLKSDIDADRQELVGLMNTLHISESRIRKASAWLVEQVAEAKFGMDDGQPGSYPGSQVCNRTNEISLTPQKSAAGKFQRRRAFPVLSSANRSSAR